MSNQKTTHSNATTQMTLFPLEEVEDVKKSNPRNLAPTFKNYDNRQIQWIYDIESFIPEHHVARVIDEMVEAIPDEQLFSYFFLILKEADIENNNNSCLIQALF